LFAKLTALQPHKDEHDEEWPVLLGLTAEAKKIFVDFYNECARSAFEADIRKAAQWSKLSAYSARLALVGQLMCDPDAKEISGDVMRAACELARWFGNEAERIYALIAETPEQRERRRLIEFIQSRGGIVSVRDLVTYYRAIKNLGAGGTEKATGMLNGLVQNGYGKWEEIRPEGRGRPTRVFRLLLASASAEKTDLRGETPNCADADTHSTQENEVPPGPSAAPLYPTSKPSTTDSVSSVSEPQGVTKKSGTSPDGVTHPSKMEI